MQTTPQYTCLFKQKLQVVSGYKRTTKPLLIQEINYATCNPWSPAEIQFCFCHKIIPVAAQLWMHRADALKQEGRIFVISSERMLSGKNLIIYYPVAGVTGCAVCWKATHREGGCLCLGFPSSCSVQCPQPKTKTCTQNQRRAKKRRTRGSLGTRGSSWLSMGTQYKHTASSTFIYMCIRTLGVTQYGENHWQRMKGMGMS